MAQSNATSQTADAGNTKDILDYQSKKVVIKKMPDKGQNVAVFVRPGDNIEYALENIDLESLEYRLVGGDIVVTLPNGGIMTFVSMALMGYSENPPSFIGLKGQQFSLGQVLSQVKEVNDLPFTSIPVEANIQLEDKVKKIVEDYEETIEKMAKSANQQDALNQMLSMNLTNFTSDNLSLQLQQNNIFEPINNNDSLYQPPVTNFSENSFTGFYDKPIYTHIPKKVITEPIPEKPTNDFTDYYPDPDTGWGEGDGEGEGEGNVDDAAKPIFYFKATAHQVTYKETLNDENTPLILGGGGSLLGYKNSSVTDQFQTETIDMSKRAEDMIIRAEDSTYFNNIQGETDYLSRVLRFEPTMPEGFYVESFSITGLPSNVKLLDKNGNEISGNIVLKDQMIFKDALGKPIAFDSADFITTFKSVEFTIKYESGITTPFNTSITANYKLAEAYKSTTDIAHEQSYANNYTFGLKDITKADDYTYKKTDFIDGENEGFILSKAPNTNTIIDGSGNSTIVGGLGTDIVYDGAGNDTIYLSGGSDTAYGGAGHNTIYGDTYLKNDGTTLIEYSDGRDKISYENVKSFSLAELEYLYNNNFISAVEYQKLNGSFEELDTDGNLIPTSLDIEMLKYYKGVYVDLKGFTDENTLWIDTNGNAIVDEDEKINALSKFSLRDEFNFTYDSNGNVTSATISKTGLVNLQLSGQDKYKNIEDIDGSAYNDTILGNDSSNIIHGLAGSDFIDGKGGGNTLYGDAGYDTLLSGSGNDWIDGGSDTDAVSYQNSTNGVVVRLDKPTGEEKYDYSTGHGNDTLVNIEDIIGSNFADTIYGSSGTNYIMGMKGDDSIFGGKGYDFIDGGEGSDWISYYIPDYPDRGTNPNYMEDIQGITVAMGTDFVMLKETSTGRLIDLIKDIEQVRGTYGNDTIWGDNSDEVFWGMEGNDDLRGNGGADTLFGGAGNDYIRPGAGLDTSYGGTGTDYLELYDDGLVANSKLRFNEAGTVQYSINTTNGTDGTWTDGYSANGGINLAYEFEGLGLSNAADTFYGNSVANIINGHNGDDVIYGMGGDDFIRGGNGDDKLYGGDGNDTIYGDAGNDIIDGGAGDDTIYGHSVHAWNQKNQDTIDGGTGNNTLNYNSAGHGGFSLDMRDAALVSGYSVVSFSAAAANASNTAGANAFDDKIKNIQNIIGSTGNDTIFANDTGMYLDGWSGTDKIYGGTGNDTIIARSTNGEILDGGGGVDTLRLAQSVNFTNANASATNNITVSNFEVLDLGNTNYYTRLNINQWNANNFNKIIGGDNTRLFLHSTNSTETFDFKSIDFNEFSGAIYTYGYSGADTVDLTHVKSIENVKFYLDGSNDSDTLKIGTETSNLLNVKLLDNYYNTFEKFDIAAGSSLEVNAYNNGGRTFYAHNKDFDDVKGEINFEGGAGNDIFNAHIDKFGTMTGKVNIDGGAGNDTFYANYEALLAGKLNIDGGSGSDTVDVRTTQTNAALTLKDVNMFKNIERLELDQISNTNTITLDARAMKQWIGSSSELTLDIANNIQGTKITIGETTGADMTNFTIGQSYTITLNDDTSFAMHVV